HQRFRSGIDLELLESVVARGRTPLGGKDADVSPDTFQAADVVDAAITATGSIDRRPTARSYRRLDVIFGREGTLPPQPHTRNRVALAEVNVDPRLVPAGKAAPAACTVAVCDFSGTVRAAFGRARICAPARRKVASRLRDREHPAELFPTIRLPRAR